MMPQVLTIAGSDSGGGAGIQADLKTFTALKTFGTTVITTVTAQNTREVQDIEELSTRIVEAQLDAVFSDLDIAALKTGMLYSQDIIHVVARKLEAYASKNIVVDPVLVATSGQLLLQQEAVKTLKDTLLPLARLITPNLREAEVLTGMTRISTKEDMRKAARAMLTAGVNNVLLKGGHLEEEDVAGDLLMTSSGDEIWLELPRLELGPLHGTGCTLAAAITAFLAKGYTLEEAVSQAKDYIHAAITYSFAPGKGSRVLNHTSYSVDLNK